MGPRDLRDLFRATYYLLRLFLNSCISRTRQPRMLTSAERHPKVQKRAAATRNPFVGLGVESAPLRGRSTSLSHRTHALGVFPVIKPQSARTVRHVHGPRMAAIQMPPRYFQKPSGRRSDIQVLKAIFVRWQHLPNPPYQGLRPTAQNSASLMLLIRSIGR